ncbi:MAG: hypothetical protein ACE5LC_07950 [Candidatus Aminicenantales bacterium]
MAKHLHKKFTDEQITSLLEKYLTHEVELSYILEILGIERRRFFYQHFSIAYSRKKTIHRISI